MSFSQYVGTRVSDGIDAPNYFNGRLLSAEDLQEERDATLARVSALGQACGDGVVSGLAVTLATATSLIVSPGLGINRNGNALMLPSAVTLPVRPEVATPAPRDDAGRFGNCALPAPGVPANLAAGAYLLTAFPVSWLGTDRAPAHQIGDTPATCMSNSVREGVQFRILRLDGFAPVDTDATDNNRRNALAHWCFGSLTLTTLAHDPFHFTDRFTGLDNVVGRTDCDLPLAVFYWDGTQIAFVDVWSARRRLQAPGALLRPPTTSTRDDWTGLLSDARVTVAQARFLQFQEQVEALSGNARGIVAEQVFPSLPPVGFLPITPRTLISYLERPYQRLVAAIRPNLAGAPQAVTTNAGRVIEAGRLGAPTRGTLMDSVGEQRYLALDARIRTLEQRTNELQSEITATPAPAPAAAAGTAAPVAAGVATQPNIAGQTTDMHQLEQLETQLREYRYLIDRLSLMAATTTGGFDLLTFFGSHLPPRIGIVDRETVDFTLNRSWYDERIDLMATRERTHAFDLYIVRETLEEAQGPSYVMFAKRAAPVQWLELPGER